MIYSTATIPVNPEGESVLSRAQLWQGLVLKARDARLFLPPGACSACEVTVEGTNYIIREATIMGDFICEFISFVPERKVSFHQVISPREGVIVNEIIEDAEGQLFLKFYCLIGLPDVDPNGAEEQQAKAVFDSEDRGYAAALRSTLARTRELLAAGEIA
ncbi:AtaL-like protein [Aquisediminimonas profunda]|uniref:AtaL-like protein n=1 Tax=Aquisediminimonas profunda TaxID=1550733 RepID=UPI001C63459E|nr:AtaL-like protein [Aquisediminimonas profunda]